MLSSIVTLRQLDITAVCFYVLSAGELKKKKKSPNPQKTKKPFIRKNRGKGRKNPRL